MPTSAVKSSVPRLSATTRGCDFAMASMRKKPAAVSTSTTNWIVPGLQAALGFQFRNDVGAGQHVFRAVHLGEHQRGDARDHGRLDVADQHAPRAIDAHQHVGTVARHVRDGIGDQGAGLFLLRWRHRVLEVEDDSVGAAIRAGADEFLRGDRHEQERAPRGQVIAHGVGSFRTFLRAA